MKKLGLIAALGAVIGSGLRFGISQLISGENFPVETFTANFVGSFLIGLFLALPVISQSEQTRVFLITGVLGGFTTFSAVAIESLQLSAQLAVTYLFTSFSAGLLAAILGYRIGQKT